MGRLAVLVFILALGITSVFAASRGAVLSTTSTALDTAASGYIGPVQVKPFLGRPIPITSATPSPVPTTDFTSWLKSYGLIYGTTLIGPTRGGPCRLGDHSCANAPFSVTLQVVTSKGSIEVVRFTSNKDGLFVALIPPGIYVIQKPVTTTGSDAKSGLPYFSPQTFSIRAGQLIKFELNFDSGMR